MKRFQYLEPNKNLKYVSSIIPPKEGFFYSVDKEGNLNYGSYQHLKVYNLRGLHSFSQPSQSIRHLMEGFNVEKVKPLARLKGMDLESWEPFLKALEQYEKQQNQQSEPKENAQDENIENEEKSKKSDRIRIVAGSKVLENLLTLYYKIISSDYYSVKATIRIEKKDNTLFMKFDDTEYFAGITNRSMYDYRAMYFSEMCKKISILPISILDNENVDSLDSLYEGNFEDWKREGKKILEIKENIEMNLLTSGFRSSRLSNKEDNDGKNAESVDSKLKKNKNDEGEPFLDTKQHQIYTKFLSPILYPADIDVEKSTTFFSVVKSRVADIDIVSYSSINAVHPNFLRATTDKKDSQSDTINTKKDSFSSEVLDQKAISENYLNITFINQQTRYASQRAKLFRNWAEAEISGSRYLAVIGKEGENISKFEEIEKKDLPSRGKELVGSTWDVELCLEKYAEILDWIKKETADGEDGSVWKLAEDSRSRLITLEKVE